MLSRTTTSPKRLEHSVLRALCCLPLFTACFEFTPSEPLSTDAFISSQIKYDMGTGEPEELADVESSRALIQSRYGSFSFVLSGSLLNELCEASEGQLSDSGERVLCTPDSVSSPLTFHDLLSGPIFSLFDWAKVDRMKPTLSGDGQRLATAVLDEEEREQLVIYDVFQVELARRRALIFHGFAGPHHLVINDPPSLWAYEEEGSEPSSIGADDVWIVKVDPFGVIYNQAGAAYFFAVEGSAGERLIAGKVMDVRGDRLLVRQDAETGRGYVFVLYDIRLREEVARVEVEGVSFSRSLNARLISRFGALLEEQDSQRCDGERAYYSLRTTLADFRRERARLVYESEAPHRALANERSPYALVVEVDPCARPNSELKLWDISAQRVTPFPEQIINPVWGDISERGGWLALWGEAGGWLLSTDLQLISTIRSGDPVYQITFH
jgi:hypothetical protein